MSLIVPAPRLNASDREEIERWLQAHGTPQQVALRGRIVLASADGRSDSVVARDLQINRKTVTLWRERFTVEGIESLWEVAPGRGRKPTYGPAKIKAIVNATLRTKPAGMTHWSCPTVKAWLLRHPRFVPHFSNGNGNGHHANGHAVNGTAAGKR